VAQPVQLGTATKTFGGSGPFLFPASTNINVPLFFFFINLSTTTPLPGFGQWGAGYLPLSRTTIPKSCCDYLPDWVPFATLPPPPGYTYGAFTFDGFFGTTMTVTEEPLNISANVGIVPEPATIWLTGTGLVAAFAALRRRRRRRLDT
ncbi:MAG: PEP-CTERM sorting domain-containing protein, partial [Gemmatimonadaceae bacterium]